MEFSYYPGCSLHSTAAEFNDSVLAVFSALGVRLTELEDWNCCGASSAHAVSHELALALPARNLSIAQGAGRDVVMPCAACFNRHKTAAVELQRSAERRDWFTRTIGGEYRGSLAVRPLLDLFEREISLEKVAGQVKQPLKGLKAVGYYGCLLVRPPEITQFENPDNPTGMNRLLEAVGADARPWSYATECCGGGLSLTKSTVAAKLVSRLAEHAREAGAEAVVTSCPLCQVNLEMRQSSGAAKLPVFYFTELVGLAFGLEKAGSWWGKHLIDPRPLLKSQGLLN